MGDVAVRVGLLLVVLAVAVGIALLLRRRAGDRTRLIAETGLEAGVYFFSSPTCSTCERAREKLDASLGEAGYVEVSWQAEPRLFDELGVGAVPAVAIVNEDGRGRLYTGQPDRVIALL